MPADVARRRRPASTTRRSGCGRTGCRASPRPRAAARPPFARRASATTSSRSRYQAASSWSSGSSGRRARKTGGANPAPLELPLVPQGRPGQGRDGDRGRPLEDGGQLVGDPRLVVVLQEAHQPRLVTRGRPAGARARSGGFSLEDAVVEPLVVAEAKPCCCSVHSMSQYASAISTVSGCRVRSSAMTAGQNSSSGRWPGPARPRSCRRCRWSSASPCRSGCRRTGRRCPTASAPSPRGPAAAYAFSCTTSGQGGKYGIAAVREHVPADRQPAARVRLDVVVVALDEELRVLGDPGVIGRDVVGHVVQDQPDAAGGQRRAGRGQPRRAAEALVGHVAVHAVGRADDVLRPARRAAPRGTTPSARRWPAPARGRPGCAPRRPSARPRRRRTA